jgi:hypothetical protein
MPFAKRILSIAALLLVGCAVAAAQDKPLKAGVAVKVITPPELMWMAGYASRTKPAEGKVHELYAKALALEDAAGSKLVLVTTDLIGLPRSLAEKVAAEVQQKTGLARERLMLSSSHTHCGPVLRDNLIDMYALSPDEAKKVEAYSDKLRGWLVEIVVAALADLKPARLAHGKGTARFAVNRREPTPKGIINGRNPEGPVDHDVPVLKVESPEGKLRAVVFGYACHNTTLQFYQWCGDYAGFAQAYLEEKYPGTTALYWIGTGGDANPLPRGTVELCRKYGKELGEAVEGVLNGTATPIKGPFAARLAFISLPLDELPAKEKLQADSLSKNHALKTRAARLLKTLEANGKLDDHYPHYPVQVWALGKEVLWISLGGEVVVDYNLRLKKELAGGPAIWITGYANDVMAYIPSARVLKEGGYEADSSMIYYGFPTRWAPAIEDKIVTKVHELVKEAK